MSKVKFLCYEETPSVEGQKGIATVIILDEIILRFKLVNRKDGVGFFISSPNLRGNPDGEKMTWLEGHAFERNSLKEEVFTLIRDEVRNRTALHPFPASMAAETPRSMDEVPF